MGKAITIMPFPTLTLAAYLAEASPHVNINLSMSGAQSRSLKQLLALADTQMRNLWDDLPLDYAASQGNLLLRTELAKQYALDAQHILTFAGAVEAIYVACHTLLSPGDRVIVITPCFEPLLAIPRTCQANITEIPLQNSDHAWTLDLQALSDAITADTKLIIINFPHNPTGTTLSRDDFNTVLSLAEHVGAWVLSDEVFRLLQHEQDLTLLPAATLYDKAISLGVMSKAYGLGGVRVGWIACQDTALCSRMMNAKYYTSICNGTTDECLAVMALRAQDTLIAHSLAIIQRNLQQLDALIAQHADQLSWHKAQAGCVAFPKLLTGSVTDFATNLLKHHGILVLPGHLFMQQNNHFRIGFGQERFTQDLEVFAAAL